MIVQVFFVWKVRVLSVMPMEMALGPPTLGAVETIAMTMIGCAIPARMKSAAIALIMTAMVPPTKVVHKGVQIPFHAWMKPYIVAMANALIPIARNVQTTVVTTVKPALLVQPARAVPVVKALRAVPAGKLVAMAMAMAKAVPAVVAVCAVVRAAFHQHAHVTVMSDVSQAVA